MTNRNYDRPAVDPHWAETRETHPAVAMAIHAIAAGRRSPEAIWEAPTSAEWGNVRMALQEYIAHGDIEAEEDGHYAWGAATITLDD
jgi:hypothetical protein